MGRLSAVITLKLNDFASPASTYVEAPSRGVNLGHLTVKSKNMPHLRSALFARTGIVDASITHCKNHVYCSVTTSKHARFVFFSSLLPG